MRSHRDSHATTTRRWMAAASRTRTRPDRFSAMTKNSSASPLTTAGDCSWNPHPSCSPAARSPTIAAPSSTNATMTPAPNATPSRRIACAAVRARCDECQRLQRQHGKHAGHQVQQQSAAECERERERQRQRGRGRRRARNPLQYRPVAGFGPLPAFRRQRTSSATALTTRPSMRKPGSAVSTPCSRENPARARARPAASDRCGHRAARPCCGADGSISPFAIGEELQRAVRLRAPAATCNAIVAPDAVACAFHAGRCRARQRIARRCDLRLPARCRPGAFAATGRVEPEVGAFGYARLLADEPVGACGERRGAFLASRPRGTVTRTRWNTSPS